MLRKKWSISSYVACNESNIRQTFVTFYCIGAGIWAAYSAVIADYFFDRVAKWEHVRSDIPLSFDKGFTVALGVFCLIAVTLCVLQIISAFSIVRKTHYLVCFLSVISLCIPVKGVWPMLFGFLGFAFFTALPLPSKEYKKQS